MNVHCEVCGQFVHISDYAEERICPKCRRMMQTDTADLSKWEAGHVTRRNNEIFRAMQPANQREILSVNDRAQALGLTYGQFVARFPALDEGAKHEREK